MDIPLPGEPDPQLAKRCAGGVTIDISSPHDIPLPSPKSNQLAKFGDDQLISQPPPLPPPPATDIEDSNRYSPSRVTDDDLGKDDHQDQELPQPQGSPSVHSSFGVKGVRPTVLGKVQAKKRLLAFSMTKQGGGQGLSFGFNKKALNKMSTGNMPFAGTSTEDDTVDKEKDDKHTSPKKKNMSKKGVPREDKARAVVSAIEEIKREEMLMRGVLGYGNQIGLLGEQSFPVPLITPSMLPAAKPRDDFEMGNILSEQQKGAIEELLGNLLTHDSNRRSKDEEREKRRSDDRRKRDSEKSSRHSKDRHRSKERRSRSGRDREKEEKKHRPSELPKNWQQFRDRGYKFEEIRRLKLKLEKDKMTSSNRDRLRRSREREHRSRSSEKRHKSPSQHEERDKAGDYDFDIMCKPFETSSRLIYPFMAVGVRQLHKQYPRSMIRFTKARPPVPYCENPSTSKAFFRTRDEMICEASERVADLMQCVMNGDLSISNVKNERSFKTKQSGDGNLSNSLAALQVSYDETEIEENMSSSDDANGNRKERPWFLPDNMVVWPDREEVCNEVSSDTEVNIKRERNEESDVESYKKKRESSLELDPKESDLPNYITNEREKDVKSELSDASISLRSNERTTVRSKWDSDYEDDKTHEDVPQDMHITPQQESKNPETWDEKEEADEFELTSDSGLKPENVSKPANESDASNGSSSDSSSANGSNADSPDTDRDDVIDKNDESSYDNDHRSTESKEVETDKKIEKSVYSAERENLGVCAQPENIGEGNTNLKLASEYEEFMKAVSFESSAPDNDQEEVSASEPQDKTVLEDTELPVVTPETRHRKKIDDIESEVSHDKLDIEPAYVEETNHSKKMSEPKEHVTPKLMTSSASEDELILPEEKQKSKGRIVDNADENTTQSKHEKKKRSSSSDSSSSSESSNSEKTKEKRKSRSKKVSKKKRKKVVRSKKKSRKSNKRKHVESSSSSDSDSSSGKDSSSSSSSDEISKKKNKRKEKNKRKTKSSSSDETDNDSSSDNVSSDDHTIRKKKKKRKAKKILKKKATKKRRRSRKETESSDSEEKISRRRSKSSRHKSSKKQISKENDKEHFSDHDKEGSIDSNESLDHKVEESRVDHAKKSSRKGKGDHIETETTLKKNSKKHSKVDLSSPDDSGAEQRERKSERKKSSSYKKSINYHESESSEDDTDRKNIKKRRRERRSCTTSPVVSSNKKRRRSPSTSPEHSPTPQRRNSAEGKSCSQRESSKDQNSTSRKLKHSSGSNKKGHKQKDLEESEQEDSYSDDSSVKRNKDFRNHKVIEEDDWDVNSDQENCENDRHLKDNVSDIFSETSRKINYSDQARNESVNKGGFSEEEDIKPFIRNEPPQNIEKLKYASRKQTHRRLNENTDDEEEGGNNLNLQRNSSLSSSITSETNNTVSYGDLFTHVKIKTEPVDTDVHYSSKDIRKSVSVPRGDEDSKTHSSKSQSVSNREICSTDSSQFSLGAEKLNDRYGSDKSIDSFRDTEESNFGLTLFRKHSLMVSRERENVKSSQSRNTNFSLDNIPLPPLGFNREDLIRMSQLPELPENTRTSKGSKLSKEIVTALVAENPTSPVVSFKASGQRSSVAFKLSPPSLLQSSQGLVDSSNSLERKKPSEFESMKVGEKSSEEVPESSKNILSESNRRGSAISENSRDKWSEDRPLLSSVISSINDSTLPEVTSSSKIPVDFENLTSSIGDSHSKERSRKRPSRWGMTTVPPKKKVVEDLYQSLTAARREVEFSPNSNINKFYDDYLSDIKETENGSAEVNQETNTEMVSNLKDNMLVAEKEVDAKVSSLNSNVTSWEYNDSIEEKVWEEVRGEEKSKNIYDKWNDPQGRKKREKYNREINKGSSEECGPVIDWEKDLEEAKVNKETEDILPITEDDKVKEYQPETEITDVDDRGHILVIKGHSSQDESGSEWESKEDLKRINISRESTATVTKELTVNVAKESIVSVAKESTVSVTKESVVSESRESAGRNESKEKSRKVKHEKRIGKMVHRRIDFDDIDPWENRWRKESAKYASKRDTCKVREETSEIKRDSYDTQNELPELSKKQEEEEVVEREETYRDTENVRKLDGEEKDEEEIKPCDQVVWKETEKYKHNEFVEEETNVVKDSVDNEMCNASSFAYSDEKRSQDHSGDQSIQSCEPDENKETEKKKRDISLGDSKVGDNKEKINDYFEGSVTDSVEKDHSRKEERIRKYTSERERREVEGREHRRGERSRKEYAEERCMTREKSDTEGRESRHDDDVSVRKEYVERERSSARDRERRDGRSDRREERRRDREKERRVDRRDRERWEREKRDRHREERESRRSRSPSEYHSERDRRESHGEDQEHERTRSPGPEYWQGEWSHIKERKCDSAGNYYIPDIPLPINTSSASGSGVWTNRGPGDAEMELSCSPASSPLVGFKRSLADSTISDSELVSGKQEDVTHRSLELSPSSSAYPLGGTPNKVQDRKSTYIKQQISPTTEQPSTLISPAFSPKRLSLDDRIEMELGVKNTPPPSSVLQYQVYSQQSSQSPHPQPQQTPPPQQQQQLPPSQFCYTQYYANVPPPNQFDARSEKFMSVPPPPYGQTVEEFGPPHMYPPPNIKPLIPQMRPHHPEGTVPKRRPPLLPTPSPRSMLPTPPPRPMVNWDSPEAFIGNQPPSSRVVQVGNVLQVVPVEVPPPPTPHGQLPPQQSLVLQTGNVLQVIPSEMPPSVQCSEPPPPVSGASSQVVQVGNVLQVIPGPTTPPIVRPLSGAAPSKPKSSHNSVHSIPHLNVMSLPPMHGPPPSQGLPVQPSATLGPLNHPPPPHGPPSLPPPPHGPITHPPPTHRPPALTPPIRVPVHTPPLQISSLHGIPALAQSPTGALIKSPNVDMSPSPAITSPLIPGHAPVPPPTGLVQAVASPARNSETGLVSINPGILPNIVPTPVAAPVSYSPPASPFIIPPVMHPAVVPGGIPEGTPVMQPQGDCPIPFLSSVELAQASQMEEVEHRRAEKLRRRAEREKRRKEKEKRHQQKLKQATEMIIKKAFEQENEMLGATSDIDLEEMRLIEEAMQQVPEQEEEFPQTDPEQLSKKRRKKIAIEIQPLPPAGKGILVSPGFREKPLASSASERKSVKFADGIRPGEGTSPSAGEDLPSPPPPPRKLPKEKRYKKKKKKKIKVKIIRQINVEDEDDDEEDISPPPPPPGSPPPPPMFPPGAHYPPTYPPGFTYTTAPPFTVLPGVDSSTGATTGTGGNLFTPLYHQHHHTTTTTHTTTVQFAPPPPVTPVPPPTQNPHLFKRESKNNP